VRILHRFGQDLDVFILEELAVVAQLLVLPGLQHHLDGLAKARMALGEVDPEGTELAWVEASPHPPIHSPIRQDVE
jgi:hypothetical protein